MKKYLKRLGLALIVILTGIQFVPVDKSNPPERSAAAAPAEVQALLRRACFDCHSNETVWPWYAHIAPGSLLIARDVKNGRKEVNFSTWEKYDEKRKARKLKEIAKEVEKGGMPPFYYLPLHPDAKLTPAERELIVNWTKQS
jgi:cytochrome c551/c552